ncbi:hypothetical protein [Agromyces arachidis]|uniref:hypothetical protein n=1 Tax=Agromyces arachidis TaxID=766966 RepID=UPI004055FA63
MPQFRRRRDDRAAPVGPASRPEVSAGARPASSAIAAGDGVLAGYRLLRRLAGGERADLFLATVESEATESENAATSVRPDDPPLVVVRRYGPEADDESLSAEIAAMDADPTGTLPKLLDLAGAHDGSVCLVVERVPGPSLADVLRAGPLDPGEVVTAIAPIVVAVRELGDRGVVHSRLDASDIRFDRTGRPRLLGLGALHRLDQVATAPERTAVIRDGHCALVRLLEDAAAASSDRDVFASAIRLARGALDARPFRRMEAEIERALFAAAAPRPVRAAASRSSHPGAGGVHSVGDRRPGAPVDVAAAASAPDEAGLRRAGIGRLAALAQLPPAPLGGLVDALDGDPGARAVRRAAGWVRRRRRPIAVGGLLGAAVLVAVLSAIPPAERTATSPAVSAAPAERTPAADATSADPGDAPTVAPTEPAALPDDPAAAAAALLEIRRTCLAAGDAACLDAVDQPGSPMALRDRLSIERGEAWRDEEPDLDGIAVTADLGDAIVLTVPWADPEREPASLLMMRSEAGWRLREWFD